MICECNGGDTPPAMFVRMVSSTEIRLVKDDAASLPVFSWKEGQSPHLRSVSRPKPGAHLEQSGPMYASQHCAAIITLSLAPPDVSASSVSVRPSNMHASGSKHC